MTTRDIISKLTSELDKGITTDAHEALVERVGQLTLEATNENEKKTYLAHGKVDFFGEVELAHSDGAGGQTCTILPQAMFFVDLAA
jgi:hypothetical protein